MTASTDRRSDADRYRENLQGEVDGAALYRLLAEAEQTPELAEVYRRLRQRGGTPCRGVADKAPRGGRGHADLLTHPARAIPGLARTSVRSRRRRTNGDGWRSGQQRAVPRTAGSTRGGHASRRAFARARVPGYRHVDATWPAGRGCGAPGEAAPRYRRQRPARGGARGQRRPRLQPEPGHGCGRCLT